MTYLIDTDVMVDFFKQKKPAQELIKSLSNTGALTLSTLTVAELRSGWTPEQTAFLLPRLFALCDILPVTREIAEQEGAWRQEYKRKGINLGTVDTVIAATAYRLGFILVTHNTKDYPMPELRLFDHPTKEAA
jgi:tRNA(fMet)-specific endonuclease VapC